MSMSAVQRCCSSERYAPSASMLMHTFDDPHIELCAPQQAREDVTLLVVQHADMGADVADTLTLRQMVTVANGGNVATGAGGDGGTVGNTPSTSAVALSISYESTWWCESQYMWLMTSVLTDVEALPCASAE